MVVVRRARLNGVHVRRVVGAAGERRPGPGADQRGIQVCLVRSAEFVLQDGVGGARRHGDYDPVRSVRGVGDGVVEGVCAEVEREVGGLGDVVGVCGEGFKGDAVGVEPLESAVGVVDSDLD